MSHEEIRKLLGGYATNTLTETERRALMEAAVDDQELFNALQDEEALRELLADPASREQVYQALRQRPAARWRGGWVWGGRGSGRSRGTGDYSGPTEAASVGVAEAGSDRDGPGTGECGCAAAGSCACCARTEAEEIFGESAAARSYSRSSAGRRGNSATRRGRRGCGISRRTQLGPRCRNSRAFALHRAPAQCRRDLRTGCRRAKS